MSARASVPIQLEMMPICCRSSPRPVLPAGGIQEMQRQCDGPCVWPSSTTSRSELIQACRIFADRRYQSDGSLTDRKLDGAVIKDASEAAAQAIRIASEGKVRSRQGVDVTVQASTICIHGDTPGAVAFAQAIKQRLQAEGVELRCEP
jgi:hypothetical protein